MPYQQCSRAQQLAAQRPEKLEQIAVECRLVDVVLLEQLIPEGLQIPISLQRPDDEYGIQVVLGNL